MLGHCCSLVEEHGLFVSAVVRIKRHRFPASLCLLFLAPLHATSTGTTGPARILRISPRLPHSLRPTSVDRNAEGCSPLRHSLSSFQRDEWSDECLVKRTNAFLSLGGVDLFFYETPLGGKNNLPPSVISIVHQQAWKTSTHHDRCYWPSNWIHSNDPTTSRFATSYSSCISRSRRVSHSFCNS